MFKENKRHVRDLRHFITEIQDLFKDDAKKLNFLKVLNYRCLGFNKKLEFDRSSVMINWSMLNEYLKIMGFEDLDFSEFASEAGVEAFIKTKLFSYLINVQRELGNFLNQVATHTTPEKREYFFELLKKNELYYQKIKELDYNVLLSKKNIILYELHSEFNRRDKEAFNLYDSIVNYFSEFTVDLGKSVINSKSIGKSLSDYIEEHFPHKRNELLDLVDRTRKDYIKFYKLVNSSNKWTLTQFNKFELNNKIVSTGKLFNKSGQPSKKVVLSEEVQRLYQ